MLADDLDPITELYGSGVTNEPGVGSEDLLMIIVPGPTANCPTSKNLELLHKRMKAVSPKLQNPKIGDIELASADVGRRCKRRAAFMGCNKSNVVLSMEKKGPMHKSTMAQLKGGDVYFNRWPVESIPWPQLMKVTPAIHDKLFPAEVDRQPLADDSDDEAGPTADEIQLENAGEMVPFPHEHNMQLGLELINVFGIGIVVTTTVGSGELMKAVLQKHKCGIGVCKTQTQKKLVQERLKSFAKLMNLVSLADCPPKRQNLLIRLRIRRRQLRLRAPLMEPQAHL